MTAIYSITPFTALDFPDRLACIFWFAGCNMRCLYCYNPEIINGKGKVTVARALDFLRSRKDLLDGVVLSGGECTLHREIVPLCRSIQELGFAIKVDTNGARSEVLAELLAEGLVQYVALDYKAPQTKFFQITGGTHSAWKEFCKSIDLLCSQSHVQFEVRTTMHSKLLDTNDLLSIQQDLCDRGYSGTHYLQNFRYVDNTPGALERKSHTKTTHFGGILRTEIR